jgi:putative tricarboxylic transport membrane protein
MLPRAISARRGGAIVAGTLAAAGAVFVWQAVRLDLGRADLPGPGLFPLALGVILVILAAAIAANCRRSPEGAAVEFGHRDVLITAAALLAVPALFEPLGAYLTLGLLGAALLVLIARASLPLALAAAGLGMTACWFLFQVLLGVALPAGPF